MKPASKERSPSLPKPSNMGNQATLATSTTAVSAQKKTTPTKEFNTYNGGRYRLSNVGKHYNSWICNKFQVQHKDETPSSYDKDINDLQNIRRDKHYIVDDWKFTRCRGKFNVYLDDKLEFVTPHDCSSTFQIDDAVEERPMFMSMMPPTNLDLGTPVSICKMRYEVANAPPHIWKPVFIDI